MNQTNSRQYQSREPIGNDILRSIAPSIFATEAHGSRSGRYAYIPTIDIVDGLRKEGFQPFFVAQSRTRLADRTDFTKHLLRLRHETSIESTEAQEVILINSHDGSSAYQMTAGVLRFVCLNGLIVGDNVESVKVQHKGNVKDMVIEGAYQVMGSFAPIAGEIEGMKGLTLTPEMSNVYAEAALELRYDTTEKSAPVTADAILRPRRAADTSSDLWTTFNRVQENLMRGGLPATTANGRRNQTREVTGIDQGTRLNRALWTLSTRMAELAKS